MRNGAMMNTPLADWICRQRLSVTAAARILDVSKATASKWKAGVQQIPAEKVARVSDLTGIPRETLRPDIFAKEG